MISFSALRRNVDTILLINSGSGTLVRALSRWPVHAGKGRRREAALSLLLSRAPRLLVPGARSRNLLSLATPGQVVLEHFFKLYEICTSPRFLKFGFPTSTLLQTQKTC